MSTLRIRILVTVLLLSMSTLAYGGDRAKQWTTTMDGAGETMLRLYWTHQYEGFDTVTRIDVIREGLTARTFRLSGQPIFNEGKTLVAFPNCWHGGCERQIRILDLSKLTELPPIQFEREWFFQVNWESERKLKVVLGAMNPDEKTHIRYFEMDPTQ